MTVQTVSVNSGMFEYTTSYEVTETATTMTVRIISITATLPAGRYARGISSNYGFVENLEIGEFFGNAEVFGRPYQAASKTLTIPNSGYSETFYKGEYSQYQSVKTGVVYDYQDFDDYQAYYHGNATIYVDVTVPALASYPVRYYSSTSTVRQQTKYYGRNLTLLTSIPTRQGYAFVSWNTRSNGTGTSYAPGDTYTANAALTLYAIFEPTITAIKINNLEIIRVANGSETTEDGTGEYAYMTFDYAIEGAAAGTLAASLTRSDLPNPLTAPTLSSSSKGGTATLTGTGKARDHPVAVTSQYTYTLTLTFTKSTSGSTQSTFTESKSVILPRAYFPMEVLAGGHGVAFGKPATTAELMDVGYSISSDGNISAAGTVSSNGNVLTRTRVKGNSESSYRTGDVNLTAANIGAAAASHNHSGDALTPASVAATGDVSAVKNGTTYTLGTLGESVSKMPIISDWGLMNLNSAYFTGSGMSGGLFGVAAVKKNGCYYELHVTKSGLYLVSDEPGVGGSLSWQ